VATFLSDIRRVLRDLGNCRQGQRSPAEVEGMRLLLVCVALSGLFAATSAPAQSVENPAKRCFQGHRPPACERFSTFEVGLYEPFAGTRYRKNSDEPERKLQFQTYASAEFGYMVNRRVTAEGFLASIGLSQAGLRVGVLARERWWIGQSGSVDLSLGFLGARFDGPENGETGFGGTADIALGWRDQAQLVIRADRVQNDGVTATALAGGVRLGSEPAVVATTLAAVTLAVLVVALMRNGID
jgi:hypothetical protein